MTSRLAVENYVVVGVTLAVITVSCQILFLPFLFSEIDAIRNEFDLEIKEAMGIFETSYERLARFQVKSTSIRRQREAVKNMVMDNTSTGPADHQSGSKTHQAQSPHFGESPSPSGSSQFPMELRKLARESPAPSDVTDYDMDDEMESEYENVDPPPSAQGAKVTVGAPEPPAPEPTAPVLPMCPLEENRCPPGLPGPPGNRGTPGLDGMDGVDGISGNDAMDELTPSYPTFCVSCPAGPDGKPGVPGATGKPGLSGAPGIPGPNGKNGQPGAPGGYGSPGKQGVMGTRGLPGGQGQDGVVLLNTKGPKGPPGKQGPDGQTGEDGTNNNTPGPMGEMGAIGEPGVQGANGLNGKRGETGEAGDVGIRSEPCTCEALMTKSIEAAENSAYTAVESQSQAQSQQTNDAPTIPAGKLSPPEIRRTPQKASNLAAGLPTLDELRSNYNLNSGKPETETESFAQEDGAVVKFAVAPSENVVESIEEHGVAHRAPIAMKPEFLDTTEFVSEVFEDPEPSSELLTDNESHVTRPALFAPPRAHFPPHKLNLELAETESHHKTTHGTGVSKQKKSLDGEARKKKRGEGKSGSAKLRRVNNRHPAFRTFASTSGFDGLMSLDEGEKPFRIEREIARESEKKVINHSPRKEIRRAPKKLRRKAKNGKDEKKLRRVKLTPSRSLVNAHRENSNILENIAKSLGLIEQQKPEEVRPKVMSRVHLP